MITVNSISGGKTSSYMYLHYPVDVNVFALVCIEDSNSRPKDKTIIQYINDKFEKSSTIHFGEFIATAEHEKTILLMRELEQLGGREITWVRGKSFDKIIQENSFLPSWNRRYCTVEMKIYPIANYTYWRYGKVNMNIGYRADERERAERIINTIKLPISQSIESKRKKWQDIEYRDVLFPLLSTFENDIVYYMRKFTKLKFPQDSNCMGCFHKSIINLNHNFKENKNVMEWFSSKENLGKGRFKDEKKLTYDKISKMNFTESIFNDTNYYATMCNSGGCTD